MTLDPRLYQIATLLGLLLYGEVALDFRLGPGRVLTLVLVALATQALGDGLTRLRRSESAAARDPRPWWRAVNVKSALISALSLCLLLRTNLLALGALGAAIAIGSKFLVRVRGKHVFNPTNGALAGLMLMTDAVWVSPGQWGDAAFFGFLLACVGGLVVNRAARSDVTYAFLASYGVLVLGRALWLGDPVQVPLHHVQSGAFLLFTFFMISDPKTTPDSRPGRILFAALVALGAFGVHFVLFRPNGLIWSLAACALLVPLIDRWLPAARYQWGRPAPRVRSSPSASPVTAPDARPALPANVLLTPPDPALPRRLASRAVRVLVSLTGPTLGGTPRPALTGPVGAQLHHPRSRP